MRLQALADRGHRAPKPLLLRDMHRDELPPPREKGGEHLCLRIRYWARRGQDRLREPSEDLRIEGICLG
jgi:hypothetical protein